MQVLVIEMRLTDLMFTFSLTNSCNFQRNIIGNFLACSKIKIYSHSTVSCSLVLSSSFLFFSDCIFFHLSLLFIFSSSSPPSTFLHFFPISSTVDAVSCWFSSFTAFLFPTRKPVCSYSPKTENRGHEQETTTLGSFKASKLQTFGECWGFSGRKLDSRAFTLVPKRG